MKKQTKLENNGWSFAKKATLMIGTFGLFAWMNTAMAQCPTPTITPSGPVDLCTGGSVTLTATAGSSYSWSTGATTQSITVSTAGSYVVTVDDGAGCIVASAATNVTKNSAIPGGFTSFTGSAKACVGQSHVYTIAPVLRAVYYIWTLPTGATIAGLSSYQTTATSVTVDFGAGFTVPGTIQVRAYNGCGNNAAANKNIGLDIPATPASITGPTTTCALSTYTFTTPAVSGVTTYTWSAAGGSVITGQGSNSVDITFPAGYTAGAVSVVNSNACGSSPARSITTRSVPPKPQPIVGATVGLCGSTQTYSIPPVAGATTYTWTAPFGSSIVSGQGTTSVDILFSGALNNGYVTVTADNICGPSGITKQRIDGEVIIITNPANATNCVGSTATFSVNAQGNNVTYQWRKDGVNLTDGGNISGSSTNNLTINPVALADIGAYDCYAFNVCSAPDTSDAASLTVNEYPAAAGPITGNAVACSGNTGIAYSISPVAGATNYLWQGFDGATIATGQGTNSVTVDFGTTLTSGYTITVYPENSCGHTDSATKWIRRSISTPVFGTAPNSACAGTLGVAYDVVPVVGATSYTWTAPANASIATGQGTDAVTVDFGPTFTSGQICVTASNICVTTPPRCKNVIAAPTVPGAINGLSANLCNTSSAYSVTPVYGATLYTWTAPAGATVSAGQGTNSVTIDFGPSFVSGNISVVAKNLCGDSPSRTKTVTAAPARPSAIQGNASPCANSTGNVYSVPAITGATSYLWTVPTGATITNGAGTNSITVSFGASSAGGINVRSVNACGNSVNTGLAISFSCRMQSSVNSESEVSIYPNPANDRLFINHNNAVRGEVKISITDVTGRTLINESVTVNEGSSATEIDITSLKTGVYMIETNSVFGKSVSRFVKN